MWEFNTGFLRKGWREREEEEEVEQEGEPEREERQVWLTTPKGDPNLEERSPERGLTLLLLCVFCMPSSMGPGIKSHT